ncbi:hypothetical protein [Hydrogenophaga sp. BPS33]|uniref:hypothetical protein n=1 Tax=Hydrogenophaga sp. BPS33 TaxID=2651974 RepID=UPI0013203894|nr:hypothetical protein [Hydrogenophaga sp. BPS33]QHE86073.1 hypothetical protein F9K07_14765 [Hydrogenophaga sp. BPS33]
MPKTVSHQDRRVAISGTDAQSTKKVWVPKVPTPRRSAFSEARQAVSRAVSHLKSSSARLADGLERAAKSNDRLRQENETLRRQLHIPQPKKPSPRASEFFGMKVKLHELQEEHKQLEASQFVLGEIASADAQLTRVIDALTGLDHAEIALEAHAFFQQLEDLDAHRRDPKKPEHTTAALFGARIQVRLKGISVVRAAALQRSAMAFLNKKDPPSAAERAVVESILFGVRARALPSKTSKEFLQMLDSQQLGAVSTSATLLLAEPGNRGLALKPKDAVPGTGWTVKALQRLQKNVDALQKKRAITPTTGQNLGVPTTQANPVRKSLAPSAIQPSVVAQTTAKRDKTQADAAQQAFQRTLVEAMNFMWNEDGSEDGFAEMMDTSASGLFVKAMAQLQAAGLDDDGQRQWIRDALGSLNPDLLQHLRTRMDKGLLKRLVQEIDDSHFDGKQDLENLENVWWHEVMALSDPSA